MTISIRGVAYELGALRDLGCLKAPAESIATFKLGGLERFSESPLSPAELARQAAKRTLEISGVAGSAVDALVYATNTFYKESFYTTPDVQQMMNALGMERAYPIGVFMSGCNNFAVALRTARGLLAEGLTNVLVACTDKIEPEHGSRVLEPNLSVISDGAATFMVGSHGGDYDVVNLAFHSSPGLADVDPKEDMATWVMGNIEGIRQAAARALEPLEADPKRVARFFCNNYSRAVASMLANQAGFTDEQCYFDNVPRFAHAYAADTLINLVDCEQTRPMSCGELAVLLGSSPTNWGAAVLRRR